ncbi:MAG: hypothetical protein BWX92_03682 [Deltaproteobacteria bacterium ADurb.Bin135]|nr:MAG: hypothetical protein BWX92_03682 [Deltaproteobacteria bacterium ADurb.Bin135]
MLEAVEAPVPDEEVPLDVPHHPLVLALGPGPVRAAGPGREPVVTGKVEEPLVEVHGITDMVVDHEALLVVHQDLPGDTAEVLEGPDDPLIGVLGILLLCAPEMKPPRISKGVHREVNLPGAAAHLDRHRTPVVLHLMAWLGLVTHRCLALPHGPLGMDIIPHHGIASRVSPLPAFHQDHLGIPDTFPQELVDERLELVELALVRIGPYPKWGPLPGERPANRLGVHPKTVSYVLLIEPFLKLFPDIHPVLLLEHRRTPRSSSHPSKGTPPRFFEGTFYFDIQGTFNIDNDRL